MIESTRAKAAREGKAEILRVASARLLSAAEDIRGAIIAVRAAREALRTEKEVALEALKGTSKKRAGWLRRRIRVPWQELELEL